MNEIVFEECNEVQVFIDDRELKSKVAKALFAKGALLNPVRLPVGDYLLSERVCVERKAALDFESSVIDGRLFTQARGLKANFESPLIALVGDGFERVRPKALRGAFISLAVDYKIPLFFFDSDEELADFLFALGEREQLKAPREARVRFGSKGNCLGEQQRFIVESFPLVGPKAAKALIKEFGSVRAIVTASQEDLLRVEGIGKKRAEGLERVFSGECD